MSRSIFVELIGVRCEEKVVYDTIARSTAQPVIDNFFHNVDVDLFSTLIGSYVELLEESGSDSSSVLLGKRRWRKLRVAIERERDMVRLL